MRSYSIEFKPSVQKDLRSLPTAAMSRVMKRVGELGCDPLLRHAVKLSGSERLYRVRAGDYRIVYEVDTRASRVTIIYVRRRRDVYRALEERSPLGGQPGPLLASSCDARGVCRNRFRAFMAPIAMGSDDRKSRVGAQHAKRECAPRVYQSCETRRR